MRPCSKRLATSEVIKTVFPDRANPVTPNRIGAPNNVSVICSFAAPTVSLIVRVTVEMTKSIPPKPEQ